MDLNKDPYYSALREEEIIYTNAYKEALLDEERFLIQKSKIEWLKEGDQNNAYFYNYIKGRMSKSRIDSVHDDSGNLNGNSKKRISTEKEAVVRILLQKSRATNKVKSGHTGPYSTYTPSTSSNNIPEREVPAGFADEVIYSLFAKQSEDLDLLHEDLEQIDDVDIEEMDINWQIAMIAIRMKKFYKKTGRTGDTIQGSNDGKKIDSFYQDQGAGKKEQNQNCLLTMDDGVVNWGEHTVEEEETNHALMAISSNNEDHPLKNMVDRGIFDSGCSGHMTGNKDQLEDFEEFNGGSVTFGGSKGYITGKGRIRVGNLDFDSVSFVKELGHFNLFSISQICDKQHKVLFTETECLVVSSDFKMPNENQILLKVPRHHNMYSFDMRLGRINFKNLNKLVKGNLVRGLPSKGDKGIKQEYSNARTPQQNGVAKRMNRTLIEVARTMLADSLLPTTFWAEAVSTACYIFNSKKAESQESPQIQRKRDLDKNFQQEKELILVVSQLILVVLIPDDSPMPELEIFHKSDTRIFDEVSYDEEGRKLDFNSPPTEIENRSYQYDLSTNPTIYDSLVKQFWQTATANTLADGTLELHATIDTTKYTITEASIRDKLHLEDASGITMLPNNEIFLKGDRANWVKHDPGVAPSQPSSSTIPVPSTSLPPEQSPPPIPTHIHASIPTPIPEIDPKPMEHTFEEPSLAHQHFSPPQEHAQEQILVQKVKKLEGLVTPSKSIVNISEEEQVEDISPNTFEAAKTLSRVASQKPKSIDKGRRYKRRKETKGKKVVTSLDFQKNVILVLKELILLKELLLAVLKRKLVLLTEATSDDTLEKKKRQNKYTWITLSIKESQKKMIKISNKEKKAHVQLKLSITQMKIGILLEQRLTNARVVKEPLNKDDSEDSDEASEQDDSASGTDISTITRKPSKTGKHKHEKRKGTKEAKDSKPKPRKVKKSKLWSTFSQPWSTEVNPQKDRSSKVTTLVPQVFRNYTNDP
ncbi:ribonuclease H-like domain-containing protein [Tanacetum coccineum]|uniref:Ribonuclease H-like domain-containing protein n=1 Tax=Tanacetum coccineum TaxID=301880 RepID=A0ABQ5EG43_9ASTR